MIQKSKRRERIMASLIDGLITGALVLPATSLVYFKVEYQFISSVVSLAVGYWYYVIYLLRNETLIGKRSQGLKVYSIDGSRISYSQCLKRYLSYKFLVIIQLILICYFSFNTSDIGYSELGILDKLGFVVKSNMDIFKPVTSLTHFWFFANVLFLLFEKNRRTLADYFAGTMVGRKVEDEIDTIGKEGL